MYPSSQIFYFHHYHNISPVVLSMSDLQGKDTIFWWVSKPHQCLVVYEDEFREHSIYWSVGQPWTFARFEFTFNFATSSFHEYWARESWLGLRLLRCPPTTVLLLLVLHSHQIIWMFGHMTRNYWGTLTEALKHHLDHQTYLEIMIKSLEFWWKKNVS